MSDDNNNVIPMRPPMSIEDMVMNDIRHRFLLDVVLRAVSNPGFAMPAPDLVAYCASVRDETFKEMTR